MTAPQFHYDDAYTTLASAQALWRGFDPHYPGTAPLYGISSPFHVVLTAVVSLVLPGQIALLTTCLAGGAVYVCGILQVARRAGMAPPERVALAVAGIGTGMVTQHFVNGLETSWALAGVIWSWHFATEHRHRLLGALCGLLPFIRPELAVWAGALVARELYISPREGRGVLAWAGASVAPWLALVWVQTGGVVPATLAAKQSWYAEGCWTVSERMEMVFGGLQLWLFISLGLVAGVWGLTRSGLGRLAILAVAVTLAGLSAGVPSVLYSYHRHRYFTPYLGLLVVGMSLLPDPWRRRFCRVSAAMALVTGSLVVTFEPRLISQEVASREYIVSRLRSVGADRVLIHDAGYLAWADAAPTFVDLVGLKTPLASELNQSLTGPSCGSQRPAAIDELARRTGVRFLVVWEPWDRAFQITHGLRAHGWGMKEFGRTARAEPMVLYALTPPSSR